MSGEVPVATKQEWAAMNSINKHFTFRERTAFLVGYRLAARLTVVEQRVLDAAGAVVLIFGDELPDAAPKRLRDAVAAYREEKEKP